MNVFDTIRYAAGLFGPLPPDAPPERRRSVGDARALAGGRVSLDRQEDTLTAWRTVLPPTSPDEQWRVGQLDAATLDRLAPARLMELLSDLSPDLSRGLWDYLRMCNPGWEVKALRPESDEQDTQAQAALDTFVATLKRRHGALDVVINRLFIAAFLRGAFLAELVLDQRGHVPLDLATPDPSGVRFRRVDDPDLGYVWRLCQWQAGELVDLDRPTIRYLPVDPFPSSPYGRPLASPVLFISTFTLAMLHDLRRVVQQQGYPRLDIAIQIEQLLAMMPPEDQGNAEAMLAWLQTATNAVQQAYAQLEPDSAYVHGDFIAVNRPVGTVDASSLGAVDGLIKALERMATRALKTMPLLMGLDMSASEAQSNRQWEVYAAGIKSLQHLCESLLEHLLGLALEAQGIAAVVEFRFAEMRVAELLRDAQVEQIRLRNARIAYDNGLISQDEQAQMALGKVKADVPEPRGGASQYGTLVGGQPDPGTERSRQSTHEVYRQNGVAEHA